MMRMGDGVYSSTSELCLLQIAEYCGIIPKQVLNYPFFLHRILFDRVSSEFLRFSSFQPLLLPTINRKVLTIPEGYLTREVQFDMGLQVQDKKYHHKVRLQSSFESKSEQDSCVWPVTRDSI